MTTITTSQASLLLQQLVATGGWRGNKDAIAEALPHMSRVLRPGDIIQTLENLKIPFTVISCRMDQMTADECPAFVIPETGDCFVASHFSDGALVTYGPDGSAPTGRAAGHERCQLLRIERYSHSHAPAQPINVRDTFAALRPMMPWLLLSSFLVNLLGLLTPLLIMAIYDRVIPAGSVSFLLSLAIGVCIVLASDFGFRSARSRALAHVGRQGERALSQALFHKIMSLPLAQLQKSGIDQQLSRFRQFEALREVFTGQVMSTLLDLPFALLFLAVLAYLAPAVGVLTIGVALFFVALSALTVPIQKRLDQAAARAIATHRVAVHDAVSLQRAIVNLGMYDTWRDRCAPLADRAETASRDARQFQNSVQSLAQTVTGLATVGAIVLSAHAALSGTMSFGVLIAVIALVSKIIAPMHALLTNTPQILSFRHSSAQADRLLALPEEMALGLEQSHQPKLSGAIALEGVTHRPDPQNAPMLAQVSLQFAPGEVVLVMGNDVAGRTALLDVIGGLHTPLAGTVTHDGIDIRQIARDELRQSITRASYEDGFFHGTIAQNFRLARPSLSDPEIEAALEAIGIGEEIRSLPSGLDTRLNDALLANMPVETLRALALSRGLARTSPIHLFSEPTTELCHSRRQLFRAWIDAQSGQRTLIIASADRSLMDVAERFVFLDQGRITVNDTGPAGRKKLQAVLKHHGG